MLSKLFPRKLNHSADSKLRAKDDMSDALNVSIEVDDREDSSGNAGVVKPIKSNVPLFADLGSSTRTVLGKVTDVKYNVVYFFVYDVVSNLSGVYAYDPDLYFTGHDRETLIRVFADSVFNFQPDTFVNADITYSQNKYDGPNSSYEDTPFLFFTDNRNEPRKLNVLRGYYTVEENGAYPAASITDFITACPKAPVHPITFSFSADVNLPVSEFRGINGFQFAYQAVFKDGDVSAISTFSEIAVPPSYINQGTNSTVDLQPHNVCDLVVPATDFSLEVAAVKILARRGETGSWFEITEQPFVNLNTPILYSFNNTSVNIAVSKDDQIKQFDILPKRAETQAVEGNRLFYGNYVEGFDNVPAVAEITAIPKPRSADFISYNVELRPATCTSHRHFNSWNPTQTSINKNSAFVIDTAELPADTAIQMGDQFTLTLSVQPKHNWHIYDVKDSYHQHNQLGDYWGNDVSNNGNNNLFDMFWQSDTQSGQEFIADLGVGITPAVCQSGVVNVEVNGTNEFFSGANSFRWKYNPIDGEETIQEAKFGTSAANPLIVKAEPISITISLKALTEGVSREDVSSSIEKVITERLTAGTDVILFENQDPVFKVLEADFNDTYTYDLGLSNNQTFNMSDPLAKLIIMAGGGEGIPTSILGNFIINKATVEFGFFRDESYIADQELDNAGKSLTGEGVSGENSDWTDDRRIGMYIKKISNVELFTCLRRLATNSPWHVFNNDEILTVLPSELGTGPNEWTENEDAFNSGESFSTHIGKMLFSDTSEVPFFVGEDLLGYSCFSMLDGMGGIGGGPTNANADSAFDTEPVPLAAGSGIFGMGNAGSAPMNGSLAGSGYFFGPLFDNNAARFLPLHTTSGIVAPNTNVDGTIEIGSVDISLQHSAAEMLGVSFFISPAAGDGSRTFKSGANHAFGVVYYDYRGRSSSVYPIGSAFSPFYYNREDGAYGRVEMEISLLHSAPSWAKDFQIVYSGNTSISDFTQYTTGGAFFVDNEDDTEEGNLYISLNYLQSNNDVSYTEAFGARSPEGARDLYTFKEGDLLRVISYYTSEDNRVFVDNAHVFEVAGQRTLSSGEDNPLFDVNQDTNVVHPSKQGNFIILKNNPAVDGFAYSDIMIGGNNPESQTHNWNKRCVVEIITTTDSRDEDNLVYYETSKVFPINAHATPINMDKGDVWWRRVPVNMSKHEDGIFKSIILEEGSQPRFAPYYLETKAFNDTVRQADVSGKGKIKIVQPNAHEVRRTTSITYSEKSNPASSTLILTSFNPAKLQFKDLPIEHGNINYLVPQQDSLFVIQANRCSSVPVDRNIITTAANDQSLVAASRVLGTERYYAGNYGCDNNPESVCAINNNVYFASKSNGEVYRFNPSNGIEVISDKGMKAFFRRTFRDVLQNQAEMNGLARVVGGYDPAKDEYIISIFNLDTDIFQADGTGGGGAEGVSTVLTNALENQLWHFIDATVKIKQEGEAVFNPASLPAGLANFYENYSHNLYADDSYLLDISGDGLFKNEDLSSFALIKNLLQPDATAAVTRLRESTLAPIFAAIDTSTEAGAAAIQGNTAQAIAAYITNRQATIVDLKLDIVGLQTSLYGGEGYSLEDPSQASYAGQLNTSIANAAALSSQLSAFTSLQDNQATPETLSAALLKLQSFENALAANGHETTLSALNKALTDLGQYESKGTIINFQNALNTQQALMNLGVPLGDISVLADGLAAVSSSTQQDFIHSSLSLDSVTNFNEIMTAVSSAGYSEDVAGFNELISKLSEYVGLGTVSEISADQSYLALFEGTDLTPTQINTLKSDYQAYTDIGSVGEFQGFINLGLTASEISNIQSLLESYEALGTVEDFSSAITDSSSLLAALEELQNYLNIGGFSDHAIAQEALTSSHNNWEIWKPLQAAGYTYAQANSVLQDYDLFAAAGISASETGIWSGATPYETYTAAGLAATEAAAEALALSNETAASVLDASTAATAAALLLSNENAAAALLASTNAADALALIASNNLASINTFSTSLTGATATYTSIASALTYLNTIADNYSEGDVSDPQIAAELLKTQLELQKVISSLSASGYSPIDNVLEFIMPFGVGGGDIVMPDNAFWSGGISGTSGAVQKALNSLDGFTTALSDGDVFSSVGGGDGLYFFDGMATTPAQQGIAWGDILNGNDAGLEGLLGGIDAVWGYEDGGGQNYNDFLPANLITAISGGGGYSSLESYIEVNGISRDEFLNLKGHLNSMAVDGSQFSLSKSDLNGDGVVTAGDLLIFLGALGATINWNTSSDEPYFPFT